MTIHETRMRALIEYTRNASSTEPYGCSIYDTNGDLLAAAVGNKKSPINHAEIQAINECARLFPDVQWSRLSLYTTGEPCCMCAAACCWSNLKEVIYATDVPFMITLWGNESAFRAEEIMGSYPRVPTLIADVCKAESDQLFLDRNSEYSKIWQDKKWFR